jgi:murein DD-endopeptidase MepM/ murein hydrolase activator NlpD
MGAVMLVIVVPASAQEPVEAEDSSVDGVTVHVVQRGETLFLIAQTYGTSVEALQAANNILDPTALEVGQRLIVPDGVSAPVTLPSVTVQPSDSLTSLALRLGASATQLAAQNYVVNPELLFAGQQLDVAVDPFGSQPLEGGQVYHVQPGDTASRIAAASGVAQTALLHANHLVSPALLYPGQQLVLPGSGPPISMLSAPWTDVSIHPLPAEQGRTVSLTVQTAQPGSLQGRFLSRDLRFITEGQTHTAIVGIHSFTRPGVYPLALTFTDAQGQTVDFSRGVLVADGGYEAETINVPAGLEGLLDEPLLDQEYALVSGSMSGFTPQRYWDGLFPLPIGGDVASAFGTRRVYSGLGAALTGRFHSGADFAMPVATPIQAPAAGQVIFAGPLEVRGNATIIDHGWGVYTGYWHQSGILVQAGEQVRAGQVIGNVGNTGLTTGAHLHWEMWVSGVQVDPLQWVREAMP